MQVLSGLGDEAYFTGNIVKGKVGVSGVIVRTGNSDLMLDVMVLEYVASPEAMKNRGETNHGRAELRSDLVPRDAIKSEA